MYKIFESDFDNKEIYQFYCGTCENIEVVDNTHSGGGYR